MSGAEIEITSIPPLSPGETSLVGLHSVLNVLNVLYGELYVLGDTLGAEAILARALERCETIRSGLTDPVAALHDAKSIEEHAQFVRRAVDDACRSRPGSLDSPAVAESVANIESVFQILEVRARELLARARAPGEWVEFGNEELLADFRQVFSAIEKNSHGRYRIIYNLALQQPADYYVDFTIESSNGRTLALPLLFKDVMRDLMANARKYTPSGGTISAGLYESEHQLKFTVQDSGCGIPPDELESVVHFGRRGSNVAHLRTMGGGFGLTKAFLVTKQFGGRFWIKSQLGVGTRIRIEIPRTPPKTPRA